MANCVCCLDKLKFMNTPTFGMGKLSDGGVICSSCFGKINNINPNVATNLKKETTTSIMELFQQKSDKDIQQKTKLDENAPKEEKKKWKSGCLILVVIAALVIWLIYPKGERGLMMDAYRTAQHHVKQHLKSPATAEFPDFCKSFVEVVGKDSVVVNSFVDSQNAFGAMIRSHYTIRMHKRDRNWYSTFFEINGVRIQ